MGDITSVDLKTILSLAVQAAKVDKQMAVYEKEIIDQFAETLALEPEDKAELIDARPSVAESLGALSGDPARAFLIKTLCAIAYSDGREHEAERAMIDEANSQLRTPLTLKPWAEWETYVEEVVDTLIRFKG